MCFLHLPKKAFPPLIRESRKCNLWKLFPSLSNSRLQSLKQRVNKGSSSSCPLLYITDGKDKVSVQLSVQSWEFWQDYLFLFDRVDHRRSFSWFDEAEIGGEIVFPHSRHRWGAAIIVEYLLQCKYSRVYAQSGRYKVHHPHILQLYLWISFNFCFMKFFSLFLCCWCTNKLHKPQESKIKEAGRKKERKKERKKAN